MQHNALPASFRVLTKLAVGADNSKTSLDCLIRTFNRKNFAHYLCTAGILLKSTARVDYHRSKLSGWMAVNQWSHQPQWRSTKCCLNVLLKTFVFGLQRTNLCLKLHEWSPPARQSPTDHITSLHDSPQLQPVNWERVTAFLPGKPGDRSSKADKIPYIQRKANTRHLGVQRQESSD